MTDREKAIVMAYTGICMLTGDKFQIFHKYVEDIMGRPVYTHEMGTKVVDNLIKEKARPDFIALCRIDTLEQEPCTDAISRQAVLEVIDFYDGQNQQHFTVDNLRDDIENIPPVTPAEKVGQWIFHESFDNGHKNCNECIECSQCHTWLGHDCYAKTPYCPICGAKMQEVENGCI